MLLNCVMCVNIDDVIVCVCEGFVLLCVLNNVKMFLLVLVYLIWLGEVMGDVMMMLDCVVEGEVCELECCMMFLMSLLELLLIFVMGGIVLVIVLVVMLLIIELNNMV